jgi:hypothetical protein
MSDTASAHEVEDLRMGKFMLVRFWGRLAHRHPLASRDARQMWERIAPYEPVKTNMRNFKEIMRKIT